MSGLIAFAVTLTALSAVRVPETVVKAEDIQPIGVVSPDAVSFEIWRRDSSDGYAALTPSGTFGECRADLVCNGADAVEYVGAKRLSQKFPYSAYGDVSLDYDADFIDFDAETCNAYLSVKGELSEKAAEFYVVEAWGSERPETGKYLDTVTVDGAEYDLYMRSSETITGPYPVYDYTVQYWSVRKENKLTESGNITGTVSVSDHIKAYEKNGFSFETSPFFQIGISISVYQSDFTGRMNGMNLKTGDSLDSVKEATGDADGNGVVNVNDMIALQNAMICSEPMTPQLIKACDMNSDGVLTVLDVIRLKSLLMK